jgi:hypothetical protein
MILYRHRHALVRDLSIAFSDAAAQTHIDSLTIVAIMTSSVPLRIDA